MRAFRPSNKNQAFLASNINKLLSIPSLNNIQFIEHSVTHTYQKIKHSVPQKLSIQYWQDCWPFVFFVVGCLAVLVLWVWGLVLLWSSVSLRPACAWVSRFVTLQSKDFKAWVGGIAKRKHFEDGAAKNVRGSLTPKASRWFCSIKRRWGCVTCERVV